MANILDKYGIKEVADVTFYELNEAGRPTNPVLFLDTLKVSTIEQTAEQSDARGGKGNPPLIIWDYGKEINVTLEDALFSAKSMAIMFGNGSVTQYNTEVKEGNAQYDSDSDLIMKTIQFTYNGSTVPTTWNGPNGKTYQMVNPKYYDANGTPVAAGTLKTDEKYFATFDVEVSGSVIEISASSFPGTYYVTGDTYARSQASGKDEFFQFIIPKAKVQSENTITLEAEGDPSVFNMSLRVMRPEDGVMMKLVKYDVIGGTNTEVEASQIYHNHDLESVAQG